MTARGIDGNAARLSMVGGKIKTTLQPQYPLESSHLPMPRNIAEPGDAGGFEGDGGVEAAGDGAVDDGLLLLVEQRDHLPFRPDRPLQPPVRPVQKTRDGGLFGKGGNWKWEIIKTPSRKSPPAQLCAALPP